jgi:hypothetical protein
VEEQLEVSITVVGGSGKPMPYTLRADEGEVGRWLLRTIVNPDGPSAGVGEDVAIHVAVKGQGPLVGSPAIIRAVRGGAVRVFPPCPVLFCATAVVG